MCCASPKGGSAAARTLPMLRARPCCVTTTGGLCHRARPPARARAARPDCRGCAVRPCGVERGRAAGVIICCLYIGGSGGFGLRTPGRVLQPPPYCRPRRARHPTPPALCARRRSQPPMPTGSGGPAAGAARSVGGALLQGRSWLPPLHARASTRTCVHAHSNLGTCRRAQPSLPTVPPSTLPSLLHRAEHPVAAAGRRDRGV